jgi:hypothetical protein
LKDFAEGSFNLCGITVTKNCANAVPFVVNNGTAVKYTFSGTVTNTGAGTVYNVEVVDTPGSATGTQTPVNPIPVVPSTLGPGASGTWSATFVTTALSFTDEAVARAASAPGGLKTVTDTTTAECSGSVNSSIIITKDCVPGTSLVDIGSNVVVEVGVSGQVTNNGDSRLTGITLAHDPTTTVSFDPPNGGLNPGESADWSATYQPAAISLL